MIRKSLTALDIRRCILTPELGAGLANFVNNLNAAEEGCGAPDADCTVTMFERMGINRCDKLA